MSRAVAHSYQFGPFQLDVTERVLWRHGKPVALTPKAFDTLLMLIRNSGRIVEKDELLKMVWPETFVEEATLAQNIFTLRKALGGSAGEQYIQTIPKRGYRFVAKVTEVTDGTPSVPATSSSRSSQSVTERELLTCSIAVLPLLNITGDEHAEHIGEAIAESVVNTLSLVPQLLIKACSAVRHYKGREQHPQEAGREIGVDMVVVGRTVQVRQKLLIRMKLVDVNNGWQLWAEEYSENISEPEKFQEIAKDISEKLLAKLKSEECEPAQRQPISTEAYQAYLKGRAFLNKRTKDGYRRARDFFEQAIEIDPKFALAYSGLADSYILFDFYGLKEPWDTIPKARAAAEKALSLDNDLCEAHTSMGGIKLAFDRDPLGAQTSFKRAIRLNPDYPYAHDGYAHCLTEMGQFEESWVECRIALDLAPLDVEINQHHGWYYLVARQFDPAIQQLQKTLELEPDFYRARILLGIAYGQTKNFSEAIAEFLKASLIEKTPVLSGFLGYAYAMAGREEALQILDELLEESKYSYVPPYSIALVYTALGRKAEAFEWLQKAFVEHSHWRGWLIFTPELDSLRSDPRFTELLQRKFKSTHY